MITIFVGDTNYELHDAAIKFDPLAKIILDNKLPILSGTYYVSLGDLSSIETFYQILDQADSLVYSPPTKWSDEKNSVSLMKQLTEFYILFFKTRKKIILGLDLISEGNIDINLADYRKTDDKQLWIAGCSISHGIGVEDSQRYGVIIADKLNLPVSFLTAPGASNEWVSEQILMSDIRRNDIVIFGLTSVNRFVYYSNKLHHINYNEYEYLDEIKKIFNIEVFDSPFLQYKLLTHLHQVINFSKKIGFKLILAGILTNDRDIIYLQKIPNYIQLLGTVGLGPNIFIDLGTDNRHPGPKSHNWYANQILQYLNDLA